MPNRSDGVKVRALLIDAYAYAYELLGELASTSKGYGQFLSALILVEHAHRQERQQRKTSVMLMTTGDTA